MSQEIISTTCCSDNKVHSKRATTCNKKRISTSETTRSRTKKWWHLGIMKYGRVSQSLRCSSTQRHRNLASDASSTSHQCSLKTTSSSSSSSDTRRHNSKHARKTISKIDEQILREMSAMPKMPTFTALLQSNN